MSQLSWFRADMLKSIIAGYIDKNSRAGHVLSNTPGCFGRLNLTATIYAVRIPRTGATKHMRSSRYATIERWSS